MKRITALTVMVAAFFCFIIPAFSAEISGYVSDLKSGGPIVDGGYVSLYKKVSGDWEWQAGIDLDNDSWFEFEDLTAGNYQLYVWATNYHGYETKFKLRAKQEKEFNIELMPNNIFLFDISFSNWNVPEAGGKTKLAGKIRNNTGEAKDLNVYVAVEFWTCKDDECLMGRASAGKTKVSVGAYTDAVFLTDISIPAIAPGEGTCLYPVVVAGLSEWQPKTAMKWVGCIAKGNDTD